MRSRLRMATILVLLTFIIVCLCCNVDDVAVYKVSLRMKRNQDTFDLPRNQEQVWSQVFGQSHNKSYTLYRIGEVARPAVREFTQLGNFDVLLEEGNEESKVYDQFLAPAPDNLNEETTGTVFADGGHSLVSIVCRMMNSPDWFIGVDSLDLCLDSTWVEQVTLDLELLDAGTTSNVDIPEPIEKVSRGNLNYPRFQQRHASPVAQVEFVKIKEYSTKELNQLARKEIFSNVESVTTNLNANNNDAYFNAKKDDFTTKSPFQQLKDLEEEPLGTPRPNRPDDNVVVVTKRPAFESDEDLSEHLDNMDDVVLAVATGHKLGLGKRLPRHFKSRLHHAVNHVRKHKDQDCMVSDWSTWTPCNGRCSGETIRTRTIIKKKKGSGRECPVLFEKKNCSERCRGDGDYEW